MEAEEAGHVEAEVAEPVRAAGRDRRPSPGNEPQSFHEPRCSFAGQNRPAAATCARRPVVPRRLPRPAARPAAGAGQGLAGNRPAQLPANRPGAGAPAGTPQCWRAGSRGSGGISVSPVFSAA